MPAEAGAPGHESGRGSAGPPRRIAMIAHSYYASDPRVRRQAEALTARGDEVTVYALRAPGAGAAGVMDGVAVRRLPLTQYRGRSALLYISRYLWFTFLAGLAVTRDHLRRRFDVVHVHNMPDLLVLAALVPRMTGTPLILDIHDPMPELYREKFRVGAGHPMIRILRIEERLAAALAERVMTVTHPARDALVAHGIPSDKIDVVLNVPDPRRFVDPGEVESRAGFCVVCHGTIVERLGIDVAIRAASQASAAIPGLRFEVIGDGDHLPELHRLTRSLGAESIVRFTDSFLPIEALTERLAGAHVAVVPGRFSVYGALALPTKLLEYAALGIPTLAADHPGVRHYFDERQTVFFDAEDVDALAAALVRLHRDPDRRAAIAAAAKEFFEEYRWDTHKSVYFAVIDRLTTA